MRLFLDADVLFDMLLTAARNPRGKAALAIELGKPGHSGACDKSLRAGIRLDSQSGQNNNLAR